MTVFVRVLESPVGEKSLALLGAVDSVRRQTPVCHASWFERSPASFANVPGSPFAYWVSEQFTSVFTRCEAFEGGQRTALGGLKTLSDERFVRLAWETSADTEGWTPLAKGGAFATFYADIYLLVDWRKQGDDISWYGYQRRAREGFGAATRGVHAYFRPGLTWSRRSQVGLSLRVLPRGCIFGDKGPAAFVDGDSAEELLALLAVTTSGAFRYLVALQMAFGSYEVGVIQRTPVPRLAPTDIEALTQLARRAWSLKRSLDTTNETSHAFLLPAAINKVARDDVEREDARLSSGRSTMTRSGFTASTPQTARPSRCLQRQSRATVTMPRNQMKRLTRLVTRTRRTERTTSCASLLAHWRRLWPIRRTPRDWRASAPSGA